MYLNWTSESEAEVIGVQDLYFPSAIGVLTMGSIGPKRHAGESRKSLAQNAAPSGVVGSAAITFAVGQSRLFA